MKGFLVIIIFGLLSSGVSAAGGGPSKEKSSRPLTKKQVKYMKKIKKSNRKYTKEIRKERRELLHSELNKRAY